MKNNAFVFKNWLNLRKEAWGEIMNNGSVEELLMPGND